MIKPIIRLYFVHETFYINDIYHVVLYFKLCTRLYLLVEVVSPSAVVVFH